MPDIKTQVFTARTDIVGYIFPFLLGGVTVAGIKYLSTIVSPAYAALVGAMPIGYLSTYFIPSEEKRKKYLVNYSYTLVTVIVCALAYIFMLNMKIEKNMSLILGCILIVILSFIRLKFFPSK